MSNTLDRRVSDGFGRFAKGLLVMLISLSLTIGAVNRANGDALSAADFSAAVDPFSRDRTIFDSDAARGGNAADIPLAGTTDAPDGAQVEARVVHADTGAQVHPWTAIAAASGGAWAGAYPAVPRNADWLRMQVRVQGQTDVEAQATSFGVGIVFFVEGASNDHYGLNGNDTTAYDVVPPASLGDFQIAWAGADGNTPSDLIVMDAQPSTLPDPMTQSVAAMFKLFADVAPGLKVMGAFYVLAGSSPRAVLSDNDTGRDIADGIALADLLRADGSEIGMWFGSGYGTLRPMGLNFAGVWYGQDLDGNVLVPSQTSAFTDTAIPGIFTVNHVMSEMIPTMLTGRTQALLTTFSRPSFEPPTAIAARPRGWEMLKQLDDRAQLSFRVFAGNREDNGTDLGTHWANDEKSGMEERFRMFSLSMLHAMGEFEIPEFDVVEWTPNYVRLRSNLGPFTTKALQDGGGPSANKFIEDPANAPTTYGDLRVPGFWFNTGSPATRTEIVAPGTETPAIEGDILVYAPAGTTFDGASTLTYMLGARVFPLLPGNTELDYQDISKTIEHLPIVKTPDSAGLYAGGIQVVAPFEVDAFYANGVNDLPTSSFFSVTGGNINGDETIALPTAEQNTQFLLDGSPINSVTLAADLRFDSLLADASVDIARNQNKGFILFRVNTSGAPEGQAYVAAYAFSATTEPPTVRKWWQSASPVVVEGQRYLIHGVINEATQDCRVWIDGTEVTMTEQLDAGTFDIRTSSGFRLLQNAFVTKTQPNLNATIYSIDVWADAFTPSERAPGDTGNLWLRLRPNGDNTGHVLEEFDNATGAPGDLL